MSDSLPVCSGSYSAPVGGPVYTNPQPKTTPPPTPAPAPNPAPLPPKTSQLIIDLPADATLTINDQATTLTSSQRVFQSPPLDAARSYVYNLSATSIQNGISRTVTRTVPIKAGQTVKVSLEFSLPTTDTAAK